MARVLFGVLVSLLVWALPAEAQQRESATVRVHVVESRSALTLPTTAATGSSVRVDAGVSVDVEDSSQWILTIRAEGSNDPARRLDFSGTGRMRIPEADLGELARRTGPAESGTLLYRLVLN